MGFFSVRVGRIAIATAILGAGAVVLSVASPADALTTINGPINLATATSYGVVAATAISNTGPTTIAGDIGLSPGASSSYTGQASVTQPGGTVVHTADAQSLQAQADLGNAYTVAASLTPTLSGQNELGGLSLTPGVYTSGNSLQVTGQLVLDGAGDPNAVWVFQAGSTLTTATNSSVLLTNGASACNVFWQVGSSATIGVGSQFVGSVMALTSVSALTNATVAGRLLAENGAVTLDTNTITVPTGCASASGTVVSTSASLAGTALPRAVVSRAFSTTIPVSGSPTPVVTLVSGTLPTGLSLSSNGRISGTPTRTQSTSFTVSASNGVGPASLATYILSVDSALAFTGFDARPAITAGALLLAIGTLVFVGALRRGHGRRRAR
ncbi:MAG: Sortase [Microbacteriaceae bacterium]|nr:Sortase [Microbacteriaceae bacterium]